MATRYEKQYCLLLLVFLFIVLIGTLVGNNGNISFFAFFTSCTLFSFMTKKVVNIVFFSLAVYLNYALSLSSFVGVLSMRRIFVLGMLCLIPYIWINRRRLAHRGYGPFIIFLLIWLTYMSNNLIYKAGEGFSALLGIAILFGIALTFKALVNVNGNLTRRLIFTVFVAFCFIIIVSIVEQILGRTFFSSQWTINERYRYGVLRTGSTMADANNVCYMLVPFQFLLYSSSFKYLIPKTWLKLAKIMNFIVIILTMSRTGILVLGLGYIVLGLARKRWLVSLGLFVGLLSLGLIDTFYTNLLNQDVASTNFRMFVAVRAMEAFFKNIWFGVGTTELYNIIGSDNTMNTYLNLLGAYGIIGLAFYIILTLSNITREIKSWFVMKRVSKEIVVRIAVILTYSAIAYTLDTFFLGLIWIIPGLFNAMDNIDEHNTVIRNGNRE